MIITFGINLNILEGFAVIHILTNSTSKSCVMCFPSTYSSKEIPLHTLLAASAEVLSLELSVLVVMVTVTLMMAVVLVGVVWFKAASPVSLISVHSALS